MKLFKFSMVAICLFVLGTTGAFAQDFGFDDFAEEESASPALVWSGKGGLDIRGWIEGSARHFLYHIPQIGRAILEPPPWARLWKCTLRSSPPTQTPAVISGVYPMNQPSELSLVVPVLPAIWPLRL